MSYYNSGPSAEAGQAGYGESYEMHPASTSPPITVEQFLPESTRLQSQIQSLRSNIQNLRQVQSQAIASPTPAQLEGTIRDARSQCRADNEVIASMFNNLFAEASRVPPGGARNTMEKRLDLCKREWREANTELLNTESEYDRANREGAKREFMIVNPGADEVQARRAVDDGWGEGGAFQQALTVGSAQTMKAQSSLRALQTRGRQLQIIAQSIQELNDMFQYMDTLVMQQNYAIDQIEDTVVAANENLQHGTVEQDKAIEHVKSRNKYRRWCLLVVILIILGVGLGVGLGIGLQQANNNN